MDAFVIILAFGVSCLPVNGGALSADSHPISEPAEAVRHLSAEFESAQRSAFDIAGKAKTDAEREAANRAMPDRRKYARRFLDLVRDMDDEAATVDALVWVVRHGSRSPEGDEAVQKIAARYLRSNRIAPVCHTLGVRGPEGEALLKRIVAENPNAGVRGQACLALAFARSLQLREESRSLPAGVEAKELNQHKQELVLHLQKRKSNTTALAAEIEQWLRQVLDEFPGVLLERNITDSLGTLSGNLGPAAGQTLRRIAETHPQAETRWEAECGLALQQMAIASLVADLRSVAAVPPGSKKCSGPEMMAACVFGGEAGLNAIDSKALVREIEQRLQKIADHANDIKEPGNCYRHLIMDSNTLSQYHAGTEALLRSVAEGHPNWRSRAGARRALAIYLAGLADLSRTIDSDRVYWVNRLGENRVEQIRRLSADRLMHESAALAEELSKENQEAGIAPDAKIEELRKANAGRGRDSALPDRVVPPPK
jgi:hypothetical protein